MTGATSIIADPGCTSTVCPRAELMRRPLITGKGFAFLTALLILSLFSAQPFSWIQPGICSASADSPGKENSEPVYYNPDLSLGETGVVDKYLNAMDQSSPEQILTEMADALFKLKPSSSVYVLEKALGLLNSKGAFDRALKWFHENPQVLKYPEICDSLVGQLLETGSRELLEPFAAFLLKLNSDPDFLQVAADRNHLLSGLLNIYSNLGNHQGIFDLLSGIPQDAMDKNLNFILHKIRSLKVLGRYDEALKALDQALEKLPRMMIFQLLKAETEFLLGDYRESLKAARRALFLGGDSVEILGLMGRSLEELGEFRALAGCLRELLRVSPESESVRYALARANYLSGNLDEAMEGTVALLREEGSVSNPELFSLYARLLFDLGRFRDFFTTVEKLRSLGALDDEVLFRESLALEKRGEHGKAEQILKGLSARNAKYSRYLAPYLNGRAVTLVRIGNWRGARQLLQESVAIDMQQDRVKRLLSALDNLYGSSLEASSASLPPAVPADIYTRTNQLLAQAQQSFGRGDFKSAEASFAQALTIGTTSLTPGEKDLLGENIRLSRIFADTRVATEFSRSAAAGTTLEAQESAGAALCQAASLMFEKKDFDRSLDILARLFSYNKGQEKSWKPLETARLPFARVLPLRPWSGRALIQAADILTQRGQKEKLGVIDSLLSAAMKYDLTEPDLTHRELLLAGLYYRREEIKQAVESISRLESLGARGGVYHYLAFRICLKAGDSNKAVEHLLKGVTDRETVSFTQSDLETGALVALQASLPEKALEIIQAHRLEKGQDLPESLLILKAQALSSRGQAQQAQELLQARADADKGGSSAELLFALGKLDLRLGRKAEAMIRLEQAWVKDGKNTTILMDLLQQLRQQNPGRALQILEEAVKRGVLVKGGTWQLLSLVAMEAGDSEKAGKYAASAIARGDLNPDSLVKLARVYMNLGNYQMALELAENGIAAVKKDSEEAVALIIIKGKVLLALEEAKQVYEYLTTLKKELSGNQDYLELMCLACAKLGKPDEAANFLAKFIDAGGSVERADALEKSIGKR